ncbi:hypothetical protein CLU79DRAFT_708133, partial [Phycomyces nitens]
QRTKRTRERFSKDCHLLLANILEENNRFRSASTPSIAKWINNVVYNADVGTKILMAHLIRSTQTTKVAIKGVCIQEMKLH